MTTITEAPCCAHSLVVYLPSYCDDGGRSDRWVCDGCRCEFITARAGQLALAEIEKLTRERDEARAELGERNKQLDVESIQHWDTMRRERDEALAQIATLTRERDEARRVATMWRSWCCPESEALPWEEEP